MYPISPIPRCVATRARRAIVRPRHHRVLLRHWGFSEQETASLLPELPCWTVASTGLWRHTTRSKRTS